MTVTEKLNFVAHRRRQSEEALLAQAVRAGIDVLYRESLTEAYLVGEISREEALRALGPGELGEVDDQRDFRRLKDDRGRETPWCNSQSRPSMISSMNI